MNEQEEKILEQYLKDLRKQRCIILVILFLIVIIGFLFSKKYIKGNSDLLNMNNQIIEMDEQENNELVESDVITNNNEVIQENVIDNKIVNSIQEDTIKEMEVNESKKIENTSNDSIKPTPQVKTSVIYQKPDDKDFLFTDGYTMENVSQVAQDYLKSSGYAGECVPLKDSEGIYIGMKVIFY